MCVKANAASGEDASTHLGGSRRLAEDLVVRSSWPRIVDLHGQKINVFHAIPAQSVRFLGTVPGGHRTLIGRWLVPIEINLAVSVWLGSGIHRSSSRKQRKS